eukprot:GEMP01024803.1.p1 GENE.GEMP01024803.1~~GEMP01024803.1.p1  ORF type:complete len:105 (-),score=19.97 GEMP01024803.1:1889-2203(-)
MHLEGGRIYEGELYTHNTYHIMTEAVTPLALPPLAVKPQVVDDHYFNMDALSATLTPRKRTHTLSGVSRSTSCISLDEPVLDDDPQDPGDEDDCIFHLTEELNQ